MYESCQRSQTAHSFCVKRLEWNSLLPDDKEMGVKEPSPDEKWWFRPQSDFFHQHLSTVLVEAAVTRDSEGRYIPDTEHKTVQHGRLTVPVNSGILRRLQLSTVGFFDFLFSNRWEEGYLLRVLPGQLLNNLLHALVELEKYDKVISFATMVTTRKPTILSCIKKSEEKKRIAGTARAKKVFVKLEYFCPEESTTTMEMNSPVASSRSDKHASEVARRSPHSTSETHTGLHRDRTMKEITSEVKSSEQTGNRHSDSLEQTISPDSFAAVTENLTQDKVSQDLSSKQTPNLHEQVFAQDSSADRIRSLPQQEFNQDLSSERTETKQQTICEDFSPDRFRSPRHFSSPGLLTNRTSSLKQTFSQQLSTRTKNLQNRLSTSIFFRASPGVELFHRGSHGKRSVGRKVRAKSDVPFSMAFSLKDSTMRKLNKAGKISSLAAPDEEGDDNSMAFLEEEMPEVAHRPYGGEKIRQHIKPRCNIRGETHLPCDKACRTTYNLVREPFFLHRHNHQPAFPTSQALLLPSATPKPSPRTACKEDEIFLGPRQTDNTEVISNDPFLEKYVIDTAVCHRKSSVLSLRNSRVPQAKPKEEQEDDDDVDLPETTFKVDLERVKILKKDIDLMDSEFFIDKPGTQTKLNTKKRLKKAFRCQQVPEPIPIWTPEFGEWKIPLSKVSRDLNEANGKNASKKKCANRKLAKKASDKEVHKWNKSKCEENVPRHSPSRKIPTYKVLEKWDECPSFMQFYCYLNTGDQTQIQSLAEKPKQPSKLQHTGETSADHFSQGPPQKDSRQRMKTPEAEKSKYTSDTLASQNSAKTHGENDFISSQNVNSEKELVQIKKQKNVRMSNVQRLDDRNEEKLLFVPNVRKTSLSRSKSQECLNFAVKSQCKNELSMDSSSLVEKKKQELLTKDGGSLKRVSSEQFYLSKEQESACREAGLLISNIDPWHIYVPESFLREDSHEATEITNRLLQRRERLPRLIEGGKMVLQINNSRLWSLVRQVPREVDPTGIAKGKKKTRDTSLKNLNTFKQDTELHTGEEAVSDLPPKTLHKYSEMQSPQPGQRDPDRVSSSKRAENQDTKKQRAGTKVNNEAPELTDVSMQAQNIHFTSPQTDNVELTNKMTEKEISELMKVFNIHKLKHSYSFEKVFSTRWNPTSQKYKKHILKYIPVKKPKKKVDPKTASPMPRNKRRKGGASSARRAGKVEMLAQQQQEESCDVEVEEEQEVMGSDVLTKDIFHHLLLALKLFVVRMERATSVNPVESKLSITFSRRPAGMSKQNATTTILDDACCSLHTVGALCRTLSMQ